MAIRTILKRMPKQVTIIVIGSLIFNIGSSLVWPYLSIYLQNYKGISLRYATILISIRSFSGIAASLIAGRIADRFGRRTMVRISLAGGIIYYLGLLYLQKMWHFILLMVFWGSLNVCFSVGVNAMIADLFEDEYRLEAYSTLRIANNVGYATGPIIGGILAARSYTTIFYSAAAGFLFSFLLLFFTIKETLPESIRLKTVQNEDHTNLSFEVFKDTPYILSVLAMAVIYTGSAAIFNLMTYYAGHEFGISESQSGYVFTVNAGMCVFLQMPIIELIRKKKPLKTLTISGVFYFAGLALIPFFHSTTGFCFCMFIMTIGELLMSPTMSNLAAHLSPEDMRGRYMSVLSLAQPAGQGMGEAIFGFIYETISPLAMWQTASAFPFLAAIIYFFVNRKYGKTERLKIGENP